MAFATGLSPSLFISVIIVLALLSCSHTFLGSLFNTDISLTALYNIDREVVGQTLQ